MKYKVAVVGATGAVGGQLLSILESRKFPLGNSSHLRQRAQKENLSFLTENPIRAEF